jgi:hypothetical protein
LFNDTYSFSVNKKAIEVNKKNIAWDNDKSRKFGSDVYQKIFWKGGSVVAASSLPRENACNSFVPVPCNSVTVITM